MSLLTKGLTLGGAYRLVPILDSNHLTQGTPDPTLPKLINSLSYKGRFAVNHSLTKPKSLIVSSNIHPVPKNYNPL